MYTIKNNINTLQDIVDHIVSISNSKAAMLGEKAVIFAVKGWHPDIEGTSKNHKISLNSDVKIC